MTVNQTIAQKSKPVSHFPVYLFWFLSPFMALINAIVHYKAPYAKNILWLFIIFYGFTFVVSNDQLDSNRYRQALVFLSEQRVTSVGSFIDLLYSEDTDYVDIVQPLLTFLVSRITTDGRILFAVFGFVFGYFYSRNVAFLLDRVQGKLKREAIPFLLLFVFIVAIWQINGFRFYTAAQVFVFGLFHYLSGNKLKGVIFACASLLVHFSFALPLVIFLIYILVGNRLFICLALYFASFFVSQLSPTFLRSYTNVLPAVFQERTSRYTSDLYLKLRKKQSQQAVNWYVPLRMTAILYLTTGLLMFCYFFHRARLKTNTVAIGLVCFGLLLFTLANLLVGVPSVGVRFQVISMLILYGAFFLLFQSSAQKMIPGLARTVIIIVAALFIIVEIRIGFDTLGLMTVIGNPLLAAFVSNDIPLIDLIK